MPEISDTYRTPEITPTPFEDGTHFDLHQASASLAPYEHVRLAREAMGHATSSVVDLSIAGSPEIETDSPLTPIEMGRNLVDWRKYVQDTQLFDEAA